MRTLKLVAGSIVVYAIVACGSAATGPAFVESAMDASSPNPFDAASMVAAVRDAIANPVPEAAAQTVGPITATENCDKTWQFAGSTYTYAEHAFPGMTATQLATVEAIASFDSQSEVLAPPGYSQEQEPVFVRDGYAATACGTSPTTLTSVTFILPQ